MTEKRYFKKMWEEEYYIFDSNTISESDFEEKLEYQDYKAFEDSMMGDEVVDRLNELNEENSKLHIQNDFLKDENQHMRDLVNENKQLKEALKELKEIGDYQSDRIQELNDENEQLKKEILWWKYRCGEDISGKKKNEHLAWKRVDVE